mgnify:CR=1 FL=1
MACGGPNLKPYGLGSAVKLSQSSPDIYIFDFSRKDVYPFGTTAKEAVEKFLVAHPLLLPPNCESGINVIRLGEGESGKAWVEFRCR